MFDLILNALIFSALLVVAVSLESGRPPAAFCGQHPSCTSMVSRYLIVALAAFPWITFVKLRAGERALQRAGTKLMFCSGVLSGRLYLSEILMSAAVSLAFLGSLAARRFTHKLLQRRWRSMREY